MDAQAATDPTTTVKLPEGWSWASVSDSLPSGGLFDGPFGSDLKTSDYTEQGVRVIRLENIGQLSFIAGKQTYISQAKYRTLVKHTVGEGDIIFASFISDEVRSCILPQIDSKAIAKADCFCLRPDARIIDARFLVYQLVTQDVHDRLVGEIHGATRPRVNLSQLRAVMVRLPPLAEQKRIVAKVEELLGRVKIVRERLAKVPGILKRFRQAVLAAACSGRLTESWRDSSVADDGGDAELPTSWRRVVLRDVCTTFQYGSSKKSSPQGKVPVLRMGNLQNGEIDWSDLVYTSDAGEIASYTLEPNTVLFNRTNSPELVGKTAIYRGEHPAIFAGYLIRIRHGDQLDPEYLNFCLCASEFREYCAQVRTDGVSQSNINAQKLADYEMPWCPLVEQKQIVRRVNALFKLADAIERRAAAARARADKLTQSILAKAFRGELVPTEAELARAEGRDYEPASVLLERIRKEREKSGEFGGERRKGSRRGTIRG